MEGKLEAVKGRAGTYATAIFTGKANICSLFKGSIPLPPIRYRSPFTLVKHYMVLSSFSSICQNLLYVAPYDILNMGATMMRPALEC